MKTVLKYVKPYLFLVIISLIIKAAATFTELAIPRMLAVIIDVDVPSGSMSAVLRSGAIMLMFALLSCILNVISNKMSAYQTGKIIRDLRHDLFTKTVMLDTADTDRLGLSSLTARLTSDTYNVMNFLARLQRMGVRAPMMLIGGIAITLTIDVRLALVLIAVLPLVSLTVYLITKKSIPIYKKQQSCVDALVRRVDETSSGIRVIKALSKADYEKRRFNKTSEELINQELKAGRLTSATKPINDFIFYMGLCATVAVGALVSQADGVAETGKLLTFMTYFTLILNSMIMMSRMFVQASRAIASASRIEEVLLIDSSLVITEDENKRDMPFIVFDNVTFSYNKRTPDINSLSFTLERGETLGIIGATGAGKSTVANLLLRLYDPDEGRIYIDGRDIRSIPKRELHSMFGVAFQYDFIQSGTLKGNMEFSRCISEQALERAIDVSQLREFVPSIDFASGYEIDLAGANLSGGQRQRLLIARAVAASPDILILDDSASALDYKTDSRLRSALKDLDGVTSVIISQRVATVRSADKILVIDEGALVGEGTHDALMQSCSEYAEIAKVQLG